MLAFAVLALLVSTQGHPAHGIRPSNGHVFVVGGTGGISTIQLAVDMAEDGDAILVKSGSYPGFSILDKAVLVVADEAAAVDVQGSVVVSSVSAGKTTLLAGLVVYGSTSQPAFLALDDLGSLRVEDCTLLGRDATASSSGQVGAQLDTDADVAFVSCTIRGGAGYANLDPYDPTGASAILSTSSTVAIQDSVVVGGAGGNGVDSESIADGTNGGPGGAACRVLHGFLFLAGTEASGGGGGQGGASGTSMFGGYAGDGGPGGDCISASGSPSVVLIGDALIPGLGGAGGISRDPYAFDPGKPGPDGLAIRAPAGSVDQIQGTWRRLIAPRIARENTLATAHLYGVPGDHAQLFSALSPEFTYLTQLHGVRLASLPQAELVAEGTIPASGALDLQYLLPTNGADARPRFLQAYFRNPPGERYVASQFTLLELSSRY